MHSALQQHFNDLRAKASPDVATTEVKLRDFTAYKTVYRAVQTRLHEKGVV